MWLLSESTETGFHLVQVQSYSTLCSCATGTWIWPSWEVSSYTRVYSVVTQRWEHVQQSRELCRLLTTINTRSRSHERLMSVVYLTNPTPARAETPCVLVAPSCCYFLHGTAVAAPLSPHHCLLWCRLATTHLFICLLCMAVDATSSPQYWYCPLPAFYPHTCKATETLLTLNLRCNYQVTTFTSFLILHFYMHNFYMHNFTEYFNVVWIVTMCASHFVQDIAMPSFFNPLLTNDSFNPLTTSNSSVHGC